MSKVSAALIGFLFLLSVEVGAQESKVPVAVERIVVSGEDVTIQVDGEPEPLRGRLLSIAGAVVIIDTGSTTRAFGFDRVARVERDGDSIVDGALLGAAVLGGLCWLGCGQGATSPGHHKQLMAANALFGGFFGAMADRKKKGTTTVYRRGRRASLGLTLSPGSIGIAAQFGGR